MSKPLARSVLTACVVARPTRLKQCSRKYCNFVIFSYVAIAGCVHAASCVMLWFLLSFYSAHVALYMEAYERPPLAYSVHVHACVLHMLGYMLWVGYLWDGMSSPIVFL